MAQYIACPGPMFKGYYSFAEALQAARQYLGLTFYIEPEEVKPYSEIAKTSPEQVIKAQAEEIAKLQQQLIQKTEKTQSLNTEIEMNLLKQKVNILEARNRQLIQKIQKENPNLHRNYEAFKARILDTSWKDCIQLVSNQFLEFE